MFIKKRTKKIISEVVPLLQELYPDHTNEERASILTLFSAAHPSQPIGDLDQSHIVVLIETLRYWTAGREFVKWLKGDAAADWSDSPAWPGIEVRRMARLQGGDGRDIGGHQGQDRPRGTRPLADHRRGSRPVWPVPLRRIQGVDRSRGAEARAFEVRVGISSTTIRTHRSRSLRGYLWVWGMMRSCPSAQAFAIPLAVPMFKPSTWS